MREITWPLKSASLVNEAFLLFQYQEDVLGLAEMLSVDCLDTYLQPTP